MTPATLVTAIAAIPFNPVPSDAAHKQFLSDFPETQLPTLTDLQYNGKGSTTSFCHNIIYNSTVSFGLRSINKDSLGDKASPVTTNIANAIADARRGNFAGLQAKHHLTTFSQVALLKVLTIYLPDKFITVGQEYILNLLAEILGVSRSKDIIDLNHSCLDALSKLNPGFATYDYNRLGSAIWELLAPHNKTAYQSWIGSHSAAQSGKSIYPKCIEQLSYHDKTNYYSKNVSIADLKTLYTDTLANQKSSGGTYYGPQPSYGTKMFYSAAVKEYIKSLTGTTSPAGTTASPGAAASPAVAAVSTIPKRTYPKNLILYGPPGTGKTYNTIRYAVSIIDGIDVDDVKDDNTYTDASGGVVDVKKRFDSCLLNDQIRFTTFHQSLSYEDFIEGIKPKFDTSINIMKYPVEDGIFKQICTAAREQAESARQAGRGPENFVLIIDEINRGNVAQIFGELITLIEEDKREGEVNAIPVTLPYSSVADPKAPKFTVPANLYILGTMNTADRSVEALDSALRRRFTFIEMRPNVSKVPVTITGSSVSPQAILEKMNSRIEVLKDSEHQIGHSYFMGVDSVEKLMDVFQHKIIPLLQEYFFGDTERIKMVIGEDFFTPLKDIKKNVFPGYKGDVDFPEEILQIWDDSKWKACSSDKTHADFIAAINTLMK